METTALFYYKVTLLDKDILPDYLHEGRHEIAKAVKERASRNRYQLQRNNKQLCRCRFMMCLEVEERNL